MMLDTFFLFQQLNGKYELLMTILQFWKNINKENVKILSSQIVTSE